MSVIGESGRHPASPIRGGFEFVKDVVQRVVEFGANPTVSGETAYDDQVVGIRNLTTHNAFDLLERLTGRSCQIVQLEHAAARRGERGSCCLTVWKSSIDTTSTDSWVSDTRPTGYSLSHTRTTDGRRYCSVRLRRLHATSPDTRRGQADASDPPPASATMATGTVRTTSVPPTIPSRTRPTLRAL